MNKKQLKQYIENPNLLSPSDTKKLSVLVEDYPYFQTARMLYAKGLQVNEDEKYEKLLTLTATYAASRAKLFELLSSEQVDAALPVTASHEVNQSEETQSNEKDTPEIVQEQAVAEIQSTQSEKIEEQESTENNVVDELVSETVEKTAPDVPEPTVEEIVPETVQDVEEHDIAETVEDEVVSENTEVVESPIAETNISEPTIEEQILETKIEELVPENIQNDEEHTKEEIIGESVPEIVEEVETPIPEKVVSETLAEEQSPEVVEPVEEQKDVEEVTQPEIKEEPAQAESLADIILRKYRAMKEQEGAAIPTKEKAPVEENQSLSEPIITENETVIEEVVPQESEELSEVVEQVIEEQNNVVAEAINEIIENNVEAEVVQQEAEDVSEIVEEQNDVIEEVVDEPVEDDIVEKEVVETIEEQTENPLLDFSFTDSEREENETIVSEGKTEVSSIDFSGLFSENTPSNDEIVQPTNESEKAEIQEEILEENQPVVEEVVAEVPELAEESAPVEVEEQKEPERHDWFENSETKPDTTRMDLIDKFIFDDPKMPKLDNTIIRANAKDLEDLSKSASNECECITESMAKIYIKQELFDKAINIYQKLILKYPEKSVYFADRIKKVQELKK